MHTFSFKLVPVILFVGFGLFWNLDHVAFWDDEAQTAFFARNFLTTGKITGWDGKNLFAYRNGSILNDNFISIQPPLDVLVTALSFRVFGESDWSARLPFAIAAFLSFLIFIWVVRKEAFGYWSILYFAFSTQFLLNGRQCRYYALCLLFGLMFYVTWREFIRRNNFSSILGAALCGALLYYSNYLLAAAWITTLVSTDVYFETLRPNRKLVLGFILLTLLTLPHALYFRIWNRHDILYDDGWNIRHVGHLWKYTRDLIYYVPTLILGFLVFRKKSQSPWRWFLLFYGNAILISLMSPQPGGAIFSDFRFLILSLPTGCVLAGYFVNDFRQRWAQWAILSVLCLTNIFSLGYSRQKPMWTLPNFIASILKPYDTSIARVSSFLKHNMKDSETFFTSPDHFNYPLMYYTRFQACCTLDNSTRLKTALALPAPLKREGHAPDWFISFEENQIRTLQQFEGRAKYKLHTKLSIFYDQIQRPEPFDHKYFPVTKFPDSQGVFIFRRIR